MQVLISDEDVEKIIENLKPLITCKCSGNDDEVFDVKKLAEYLKVSTKWVYASIKEMNIPYIKLRGHIRFKKSAIDKWVDSHNVPAVNRIDRLMKAI